MINIELQYIKMSKRKAMNLIIKRLELLINGGRYDFEEHPYVNIGQYFKTLTRDLTKIYDFIFYAFYKEDFNLDEKFSRLNKFLDGVEKEINWSEFFLVKYELDSLLQTNAISDDILNMSSEDRQYLIVTYNINCYIEAYLLKSHKRVITGVDMGTNTLKYRPLGIAYFDLINLTYKTEDELNLIRRVYKTMFDFMTFTLSDETEDVVSASVNDKIDDTLRAYRNECVLVDIINQTQEDVFPMPDLYFEEEALKSCTVFKPVNTQLQDREFVNSNGALILIHDEDSEIKSVLCKDILLLDKLPCVVMSYVNKEGKQDTAILPIEFDSLIVSRCTESVEAMMYFYGIDDSNLKLEIVSKQYWKYRFEGYKVSKDTLTKRYFQEQDKEIKIHKARLGNASDESLALANKWGIKLKEGETVVRTHIRHYGKK